MSVGDSIIRVSIIGDAKRLVGALGEADKATSGLLASSTRAIGGTLLALGGIREGFQFLGDSLNEADRLGDAMARLNAQLGPEFTSALESSAGSFHDIGQSSQDILELEAIFADWATSAGIADPIIATMADDVAGLAAALALTDDQGRPATAMLDLLDKAARGSAKAAAELGVTLTDGLSPADQMRSIMEQLSGRLNDARTGSQDLEGAQAELQASVEELQAKIGGPLADALKVVVGFINDEIDAIPHAIEGWQALGGIIETFGRTALGPLGNVADALRGILDLLGQAGDAIGANGTPPPNFGSFEADIIRANRNFTDRNGLERSMGGP